MYHSQFDASHQVAGVAGCDRPHGHTFEVTASVEGPLLSEGSGVKRVARSEGTQQALDAITAELDRRDLDAMMPGSLSIPEVIAAWILERLPDCSEVQVEMGWRRETGKAKRYRR